MVIGVVFFASLLPFHLSFLCKVLIINFRFVFCVCLFFVSALCCSCHCCCWRSGCVQLFDKPLPSRSSPTTRNVRRRTDDLMAGRFIWWNCWKSRLISIKLPINQLLMTPAHIYLTSNKQRVLYANKFELNVLICVCVCVCVLQSLTRRPRRRSRTSSPNTTRRWSLPIRDAASRKSSAVQVLVPATRSLTDRATAATVELVLVLLLAVFVALRSSPSPSHRQHHHRHHLTVNMWLLFKKMQIN